MFEDKFISGRHEAVVRIDLSSPDNRSFENVKPKIIPLAEYSDGKNLGLFYLNVESGEVLISDVVEEKFRAYAVRLANTYLTSTELGKILNELKAPADERSKYDLKEFLLLLDSHYTKIIDFYKNTNPNHVNYKIACDAWKLVSAELKTVRARINISLSTEAVMAPNFSSIDDDLALEDTNIVLADTAVSDRN
jgi:hypothetical protein